MGGVQASGHRDSTRPSGLKQRPAGPARPLTHGDRAISREGSLTESQLFDRTGRTGHLAAVGTAGPHTDRGAALSQPAPLFVSVDEDSPLVKDSIQKHRRPGLHPLKLGDIHPAAAEMLQADAQLGCRQRTITSERDQRVEIRARVLVASRQRAVEHSKADAVLSSQRAAQTGEERPMSAEILALARCESQPSRSAPGGTHGSLSDCPSQRTLLDIEVGRQFLECSHAGEGTAAYVRYDPGAPAKVDVIELSFLVDI